MITHTSSITLPYLSPLLPVVLSTSCSDHQAFHSQREDGRWRRWIEWLREQRLQFKLPSTDKLLIQSNCFLSHNVRLHCPLQEVTECAVSRNTVLLPWLAFKATEVINHILKHISHVDNVEILIICHCKGIKHPWKLMSFYVEVEGWRLFLVHGLVRDDTKNHNNFVMWRQSKRMFGSWQFSPRWFFLP